MSASYGVSSGRSAARRDQAAASSLLEARMCLAHDFAVARAARESIGIRKEQPFRVRIAQAEASQDRSVVECPRALP